MKPRLLICVIVLGFFALGNANSDGEKKPAPAVDEGAPTGRFHQLDTGDPRPDKPRKALYERGDWVLMHSIFDKKEAITGLKVEIEGDALEKAAVLAMVVPSALSSGITAGQDSFKSDITCLLKAAKTGVATVKITPIGKDGRERPVREIIVKVRERLRPLPKL